jgi:hypothetical protein
MNKFLLLGCLFLAPSIAVAAVGCDLNDPDRDIARLFPDSSGYKTVYLSIKTLGGDAMLRRVEQRLGDSFHGLYETIEVPYTLYEVYKGKEIIGYVHGVNQKGDYGGIQVFLSLGTNGVIKSFYIQKLTSKAAKELRSKQFGAQFEGLSLKDFQKCNPASGQLPESGPLSTFKNPASASGGDFGHVLRAVKKNLILMDEFVYSKGKR